MKSKSVTGNKNENDSKYGLNDFILKVCYEYPSVIYFLIILVYFLIIG